MESKNSPSGGMRSKNSPSERMESKNSPSGGNGAKQWWQRCWP